MIREENEGGEGRGKEWGEVHNREIKRKRKQRKMEER